MAIDLNDKTANGNNLTNNGAAEVSSGLPFAQSQTAVDLESTETDYLEAADSASLSITGNMTLECWVNFESTPASGNFMWFLSKWAGTGNQRSFIWGLQNNGGTLRQFVGLSQDGTTGAGQLDEIAFNWTPTTDSWYHLALTVTPGNAASTEVEFFIDGTSQGNGTVVTDGGITAIFNSTAVFRISGDADSASLFDGKIDDVRVWNIVRSQAQIDANKGIELTGEEANLVAYWPFESSLGAEIANKSYAYFM